MNGFWVRLEEKIAFWVTIYPAGIALALLLTILRLIGRLKIKHFERFPRWRGNLILASNHPSLWEPLLLPALFARQYLRHPRQFAPWSAPDETNYRRRWWFYRFCSERLIFVPRGNPRAELEAIVKMSKKLQDNGVLILFPEGGRTGKGNNFVYSKNGKKLRPLKAGIGRLVLSTSGTVVPVWVKNADKVLPLNAYLPRLWRKMAIKIGQPVNFSLTNPTTQRKSEQSRYITAAVTTALIQLAEEDEEE